MGTRLAMRGAGRHPDEVAACAGFHGGGLVTDAPDSPHLEVATAALAAAGLTATNAFYEGAPHGHTTSDTSSWNEAVFVRAFSNLRDLYSRTLSRPDAQRQHGGDQRR